MVAVKVKPLTTNRWPPSAVEREREQTRKSQAAIVEAGQKLKRDKSKQKAFSQGWKMQFP